MTANCILPPILEKIDGQFQDYTKKFEQPLPPYDDVIRDVANQHVAEPDRQKFIECLSVAGLTRAYESGQKLSSCICRMQLNGEEWHYRQYVCSLSQDEQSGHVISMLVSYEMTDETAKTSEEKQLRECLMTFGTAYETIYRIDIRQNDCKLLY